VPTQSPSDSTQTTNEEHTRPKRWPRVAITGVVTIVAALAGATWYFRSDGLYLRSVQQNVSTLLGLPTTIESVDWLSPSSRRFHNIVVTNPTKHRDLFRCAQATWTRRAKSAHGANVLTLTDGWLVVGAHGWDSADYRGLLETGLGQDFDQLNIRRITLENIDLKWEHPKSTITADATSGEIRINPDEYSVATLTAGRLNGVNVDVPIHIMALFTPGAKVVFHNVVLDVPDAPLEALALDPFVNGRIQHGRFTGRLSYRENENGRDLFASGAITGGQLSEWTTLLPSGPYDGLIDIALDDAVIRDGTLETLRFSGSIHGLNLEQVTWFLPVSLQGALEIRIHQALYTRGVLQHISAEGSARNVPLEPLTRWLGKGRITGTLSIEIHSFLIVDDKLQFADVTVSAVPPENSAGTIDREILAQLSSRTLGIDVTTLLPSQIEQIEYTNFGMRLVLNRHELRVRGTHGKNNKNILTIRALGREFSLLTEPDDPFHVDDLVALAREHLSQLDLQQLRKRLVFQPSAKENDAKE
jgi:hypothetical protein